MKKLLFCLAVAALATAFVRPCHAQEPKDHDHKDHKDHDDHKDHKDHKDDHEAAEVHGGEVVATEHHHFEVVFTESTVRVYVMDAHQKPLETDKVTGSVKVTKKAGEKPVEQALKNVEADPKKGTTRDFLEAPFDSKTIAKDAKVTIELANLADEHEKKASFEVTFAGPSPKVEYVCPKNCGGKMSDPGSCSKCKVDLKKTGGDAHDHKK